MSEWINFDAVVDSSMYIIKWSAKSWKKLFESSPTCNTIWSSFCSTFFRVFIFLPSSRFSLTWILFEWQINFRLQPPIFRVIKPVFVVTEPTNFSNVTSFFLCRFAPIIGQFKISDIATMSFLLNQIWGRIVKVGGLMGRPDLLFVFDADEIENVSNCCFATKALALRIESFMTNVNDWKQF